MNRCIVAAFLAAAALRAFALDGPGPQRAAAQAAPSFPAYDIDIAVNPGKGTIAGAFRISIPEAERGARHFIRLLPNLDQSRDPKVIKGQIQNGPEGSSPGWAKVSALVADGSPLPVEYARASEPLMTTYGQDSLFVIVPAGTAEISFSYEMKLPKIDSMDDMDFGDIMQSRFTWFPSLVREERAPDYILPFFTYSARVRVAAPPAAAPAALQDAARAHEPDAAWRLARMGTRFTERGEGLYDIASSAPVASMPLVLVRGYRYLECPVPRADGSPAITLTVYYRPQNELVARFAQSIAGEVLADYSARYFPLDYAYVSVVQGGRGAAGMGADSVISITDGVWDGLDRTLAGASAQMFYYALAHEIGHFWFGISNCPDFLSQNYLSEGLNELSTLGLYEAKYGRWNNLFGPSRDAVTSFATYLSGLRLGDSYRSQKDYQISANARSGWDQALSLPAARKIGSARTTIDYAKSTFVLDMAFSMAGRDRVGELLRDYLEDNRYRNASTASLQASLEKATGLDYRPFFQAFVTGNKRIDYSLSGGLNGGSGPWRHSLVLSDLGDSGLSVPTAIALVDESGGVELHEVPGPGTYEFQTAGKISYAMVDIESRVLDPDRKNNAWPRQIAAYGKGKQPWLGEFGMDVVGETLVSGDSNMLGLAGILTDRQNYQAYAGALASPGASLSGARNSLDLTAGCDFYLPANVAIGLQAAYVALASDPSAAPGQRLSFPNELSSAGLSIGQTLMPDMDSGYAFRTQPGSFNWKVSAGLGGMPLAAPASGYAWGSAALGMDLSALIGTKANAGYEARLGLNGLGFEQRVSAGMSQLLPSLNRTSLGAEASGSAILGAPSTFSADASALGTAPESAQEIHDRADRYALKAGALLGFQAFNSIDVAYGNLFVLQSLNLALRYEAATDFRDASGFLGNLQQAVGIELVPTVRISGDVRYSFGFGISLNVTSVMGSPADPSAWSMALYIDSSPLLSAMAASLAY